MAGCNCLIDTKTMENQESRSLNAGDKVGAICFERSSKQVERKRIFAISGVKNSGKTTLICRLWRFLKTRALK